MNLPLLNKKPVALFGATLGAFVFVHLFPFLYFKQWLVLGFDAGLYRRYLLEPLTSIPHAAVPGLDHTVIIPRVWLDLFRLLGLSTDVTLYLSYIGACAFLLNGFYAYVQVRTTSKTAYFAVLLVLFSPVYYLGYWFFLYKNVLALGLWFWLLYCLERRYYARAFVLACLIPLTHQSTTIFVGVILFLLAIHAVIRQSQWKFFAALWFVVTLLYLVYHPGVVEKVTAPPTGIFLTGIELTILLLPLVLVIVCKVRSVFALLKRDAVILCTLGLSLVWLVSSFPYAERLGFFVVFFLVIVVAETLVGKSTPTVYLVGYLCCSMAYGVSGMSTHQPYFDSSIETSLHTLITVPSSASLLTPNYLAATVQGYTTATVYAPGLFKDPATPAHWEFYFTHQSPDYDTAFLASFPEPLYLFIPDADILRFLPLGDCIQSRSQYLYQYICSQS